MTGTEPNLAFTFEGRTVEARAGQSIAGALHATGRRTLSRGIKYNRPRGYTCGFGACGDCPLNVDGMPHTVSCTTPVRGGEQVRRETGLPSAGFNILRVADLLRPMLRAGFQFSLFAGQPRLSKIAGSVLSVLAGGGRSPDPSAIVRSTIGKVELVEIQVLVIGGGVSGLTAALAAAEAGASVVVVDQELEGGRSRVRAEDVSLRGEPVRPRTLVRKLLRDAQNHDSIRLIRGIAAGWLDGIVPVVTEGSDTRFDLRPESVILATGSYETPILVPGHDLPGVMLADGALRLALVERVRPGRRAVVVVADASRSEAVVEQLELEGVEIVATVQAASVSKVTGWGRATGVRVTGPDGRSRRLRADVVCMVGPRRPAEELVLHAAYADAGSHEHVRTDRPELSARVAVVGSAAGSARYEVEDVRRIARTLAAAFEGSPSALPRADETTALTRTAADDQQHNEVKI